MGLIWTVGQTGLSDTNAHLCELFSRYLPDVSENCHASDWIVSGAGYLCIIAIGISILDLIWIFSKRSDKPPSGTLSIFTDPPIEIIFDPTNPAERFWSFESPRDEQGNKKPGIFLEYRVEITNRSSKTLRNASVTIEHIGKLPLRPTDTVFDKIRKTSCDLKPECSELAPVIRWPHPKTQAGMLATMHLTNRLEWWILGQHSEP